ncbi:uncharacterized protein LOC126653657 [Mercurialis annua]|uniref:uncharacterized protein LOC126653657 n=1 Tax=Mercurialis annua TaxID=3986 RepID=UPI00215EC3DC|nr:uncharacterized protein LOC126653657 [Mercurialis annua]
MACSYSSILKKTLLAHIKLAILAAQSYLQHFTNLYRCYRSKQNHQEHVEDNLRPPPSMVPVPYMSNVVSKLIKKKLPVTISEVDEDDNGCAICLNCIEKKQEIRLLGNCRHLYHKDCIDKWIDCGHGSCPLCRLKLLPADEVDSVRDEQRDPWREERIAYLFGEDCVLDHF